MNKENVGLYDQSFEHDNCGIGAVVNIKGLKTYKTVDDALKIVEQLEHRAGKDAAGETGDGVGILTQIPDEYFQKIIKDFTLPQKGHYGVGMFFMPQDEKVRLRVKKMFETVVKKEGLEFLGWRAVPTVPSVLGKKALDAMPYIVQAFIKKPHGVNCGLDFDRKLYDCINEFNGYKEHYSNLRDNDEFMKIDLSIRESEVEMSALRKYYNDVITDYNKATHSFPSILVALIFRYKKKFYYDGKNMDDEITNDFRI